MSGADESSLQQLINNLAAVPGLTERY
jgi:hypothetical protein